ncbi:protein-export chaperone SecB [uncultured Sphingomonas sp.]|uniref:protein-export chaperone SecB n=1 Tax=uncultured Sphingomonas sp. TaxID=158754 RepID=UPI0025F93429|nr:protein-export chaperone SecB [uncultured Sphingomonas sp.]
MAENDTAAAPADFQLNGEDTLPQIGMIAQYVKDLSFENPNAPAVFQSQVQPQIEVQFNISVNNNGEDVSEVAMKIEVRAVADSHTVFAIELVYAGLFGARNVSMEQLHPFLYAEAPRLMFPFARRIISDMTRDGGFPPLLLDPVDFASMYMAQTQQAAQLAESEPAGQA